MYRAHEQMSRLTCAAPTLERPSHWHLAMPVRHLPASLALVLAATILAACDRAPSRSEALEALRAASPGLDTITVFTRVWQDGPPWFSCAEVIAKFTSPQDSAVVRDAVGNWRPLVLVGWLVLRDTASGVVSDPGWCSARLTDPSARLGGGWIGIVGDTMPSRTVRRGWRVPIGTRRLTVVGSPKASQPDVATVEYVATIAANVNGVAIGAQRDSTFAVAELRRIDGRWHVVNANPRRASLP